MQNKPRRNGLLALSPILAMIVLLLGFSVHYHAFSNAPLLLIFIITAIVAIASTRGVALRERLKFFAEGAGSPDMLLMVWIFVLAGAFAASARAMGAVDATVNLTLQILPSRFALPGLFLSACLVSLCMGTSVGTIITLIPIAVEMANRTGLDLALVTAAVVGGAFFGDNLSFISDTTIVSTQSQGCELSDKFKFNIRMVLPAALAVCVLYSILGASVTDPGMASDFDWWKVIPYLMVLLCGILGVDVLIVLLSGNVLTAIIGIMDGSYNLRGWTDSFMGGVMGMSELIIISMLAGGIFSLINRNGGITYIIRMLAGRVHTRKGGELTICSLVVLSNMITANNTVAILSVGRMAKHISAQFHIDPRRTASLLDTTSCCVQGLLPYGAQLLMASGLAGITALSIIPYLFYPMLLGVVVLFTIFFSRK